MVVTSSNPNTAMKFSVCQYGNQGYRTPQLNRKQRDDHHYVINTKVLLLLAGLCRFLSSSLEGIQPTPNQAVGNFFDNGEFVQKLCVSQRSKVWIQLINMAGKKLWLQICKVNNQGNPLFIHRKFRLNMRKNFFPLRVTEHWNRLPRKAVDSPSVKIFKTRLDKVLCSLL